MIQTKILNPVLLISQQKVFSDPDIIQVILSLKVSELHKLILFVCVFQHPKKNIKYKNWLFLRYITPAAAYDDCICMRSLNSSTQTEKKKKNVPQQQISIIMSPFEYQSKIVEIPIGLKMLFVIVFKFDCRVYLLLTVCLNSIDVFAYSFLINYYFNYNTRLARYLQFCIHPDGENRFP